MSADRPNRWPPDWRSLWRELVHPHPAQGGASPLAWRESLLAGLLLLGLILGLPAVGLVGYSLAQEQIWSLLVLDIAIYLLVAALYLSPGLPYRLRAGAACLLIYLTGAGVIAQLGPFSGGPAYLFVFCILSGVLLGVWPALASLALNLVTLTVVALLMAQGYFPESQALVSSPNRWLAAGTSFVLLNLVATISVALVVRSLERSLAQEASARAELEREARRRAAAEEDLAEREKWYRTTFEHTGTAMVVIAEDTTLALTNQRFSELSGYSPAELAGKSWQEFVHPDDLPLMQDYQRQRRQGEAAPSQYEFRFLDRRGKERVMLNTVQLIPGTDFTVASLMDLTERKQAEQALGERERLFRLAFHTSPDSMNINRLADGVYVSVNQGFTDLTGYTAEEVLGRSSVEKNIWAEPDQRRRLVEGLLEQGVVRNLEAGFRLKDGRVRTGLMSAAMIELEGAPHILSITRDVEDWKETERALRESEDRARAILQASPDPMVVYDGRGRVTYFNPAFTRVFGWELAELRGRTVPFVPESEEKASAAVIRRCLDQDDPVSLTTRRRTKDGRLLDVMISAARTVGPGGRTSGMVVNLTDITERRGMERALEESERRYRDLVDNITDFIYTHDLEGRFTSLNLAACQTLGYEPQELIGRPIPEIMPPEHGEAFHQEYLPEILRQGSSTGLSIYLDREGGRHYLEYRSALVRGPDQEPFVRGSAREVTDKLLAQREQRNLEEQLFQAQKMEALGTLTGGVAHDFNNILAAIMGSLELAESKLPAEHAARRHLESAVRAARRAGHVTRQLLATARRAERRVQPVRLDQLIQDTVGLISETIDRRIAVRVEAAPDLYWVSADEAQIGQVIMNLAVNARDAVLQALAAGTGAGREHYIKVSARNLTVAEGDKRPSALAYPGRFVEIEIADTGCGMDPAVLERIYEPFFTTKPPTEGTGLGLATAYGIVDQHRGWLEASSRPGEGASFRFFLPAAEPEPGRPASEREAPAAPAGGECVLVVDDEPQVLEITREALGGLGYRVVTAADGEEALAEFQRRREEIGLVLLDLTMPKLSGREVAHRILEMEPQARIIISSGNVSQEETIRELRKDGRLAFLPKPYRLADLARAVRGLLEA